MIDDLSGVPRSVQIARIVETEIRAGQLADRFGVARETAARAHQLLAERGFLVAAPGVGMIVTPRDRWPDQPG